jgi:beta-glucosidase
VEIYRISIFKESCIMKCCSQFRFVAAAVLFAMGLTVVAAAQDTKPNPATTPSSRSSDAWWKQRHESMNARVKQGHADLIFIGDSITNGWEGGGKDVWQKYYGKRNAVNLGIGGDQTCHVLWRLDHGNIDGISPKLAVVMIGTNNSGSQSPEQIASGVKAIIDRLQAKLPETKILLLAIFPRGVDKKDNSRQVNAKANALIAKFGDDKSVFYLDINSKFLNADETLSTDIMPDLLHPNAKGYQIWAEAIEPMVVKLMGEK